MAMPSMILHHYPISTSSERVRLAMGLKRLTYNSVTIPIMLPKPDLLPLTGGYRRTPVLQIGADIYCDTFLILRRIERLHPKPSLHADTEPGLVAALTWWVDKTLFLPALGLVGATKGHTIPKEFLAERKAFGFPLAPEDVAPVMHRHLQQGAAHLAWLSSMLSRAQPFLLGDRPSALDLAAYCHFWLLKNQGGPDAEARLPLAPFHDWYERVTAIGHGSPVAMRAEEALDVAAGSEPLPVEIDPDGDPSGLKAGTEVIVTADDTGRDPVRGTLVAADAEEMVVRSSHPRVGEVALHFPRVGFDVVAA